MDSVPRSVRAVFSEQFKCFFKSCSSATEIHDHIFFFVFSIFVIIPDIVHDQVSGMQGIPVTDRLLPLWLRSVADRRAHTEKHRPGSVKEMAVRMGPIGCSAGWSR